MDISGKGETLSLDTASAHDLLSRAAELDTGLPSEVTIGELRRAAQAAGMAPGAFDAAVAELQLAPHNAPPKSGSRPPWWVRLCLFGVPDRRAAMGFYWIFVAASLTVPLWIAARLSNPTGAIAATSFLLFFLFASWSTSKGVKWADAHGWDSL